MDIKLKLRLPFVRCWNKLRDEYGEDFERLNGLHNDNLSFSDFIDHFTNDNEQNVADVTIDSNANSNSKDVRTLMSDMVKPHTKLLAYNKIFYELTKKYGLEVAEDWLRYEWNGALYLHDAPTSSFLPYCYKGEETLTIQYNGETSNVSLSNLYNLIEETESFDPSIGQNAKFPSELYVLDLNEDFAETWTRITRVVRHQNENDMMFVKYANGISQIVTDNHPIITSTGDIQAKEITNHHQVFAVRPTYFNELDAPELTNDFGWLLGMLLAEGVSQQSQVSLRQHEVPQREKFIRILNQYNIPYVIDLDNKIRLRVSSTEKFFENILINKTSSTQELPKEYVHYPHTFLDGIVAGLIDGDGTLGGYKNRQCQIRIASELLCRQISNYLQFRGIFCGDRTPHKYTSKNSFNQQFPLFGICFTLSDEHYFQSIGSIKINTKYNKTIRRGNFCNKKYQYKYGWINVLEKSTYIEKCAVVFDITTESGHFICNNILSHNCFAYDLDQIAERGLFFINAFRTGAPKHLTTFNDHTLEFVSWASNRTSGAVGLPSYLVYSYYFWKKDVDSGYYMKDPEYYRRQCFQKFCYDLNQPYLRVTECAFTNITIMDHPYLEELFGGRQYPDGSFVIDSIDEIIEHQKVFMDVVSEVRENTMMTFPVLTYSLLYQNGKFIDEEFAKWCNRHNMKWADANFYVGRDVTSLSSCCRLINDFSKLDGFINSIGGTSLKIGSVKVNTINLRRIAIESKIGRKYSESKFLEILENRVRLCIQTLDVIRGIIKRDIEKGLLPNYTYGLIEIDRQYCTIGIAAMYEAIREFGYIDTDEFNNKSYSDDGIRFASEIMQRINHVKDSYSLGYSINVEAVPAERCAVVLCQKDTLLFGNKYKDNIYSNQWIPLTEKCSLNEKIRLGAILDKMCGGGQIAHINLAGQFQSEQQSWDLLNQIAEAGVLYFAYNLRISVCENEHGFFGEVCPKCGCKKVDSFQRIVGYLVPSRNYSKERKAEYNKRVWFNLNENGVL